MWVKGKESGRGWGLEVAEFKVVMSLDLLIWR